MRSFLVLAARATAWLLMVIITVLSLVPPEWRPESGLPNSFEHFGVFAATGAAFGIGYFHRPKLMMVALVIFVGAIEFAQMLVPGRHARLTDFIVDAVGMCLSVVVGSITARRIFAVDASD